MAAGDLVQLGTSVVVGLNGRTYGTLIPISGSEEPLADVKEIKGAQGATVTKLITNPGYRVTVKGVMLSADLTALEAINVGSTVSLDGVNLMLESLTMEFTAEDAIATIVGRKEDSMTYT